MQWNKYGSGRREQASGYPPRSRASPPFRHHTLLALAGLVWWASWPQPTGPAAGVALNGEVVRSNQPSPHSFRVGTFNIDGCKGADGRRDVDRVAGCLADLDFVALNEVHGPRLWERDDQAALLGRRMGRQWLFAPATRDSRHIDFGNGLLTSLPVESWQRIPLSAFNGRGYRNAVFAQDSGGQDND